MEWVIVKRADGTLELRVKTSDFSLADGETLVPKDTSEAREFLEAEVQRRDNEEESAKLEQRLAEQHAARNTPQARKAADAQTGGSRGGDRTGGGTAVLDKPDDEKHRDGQAGEQRDERDLRNLITLPGGAHEARAGLGLDVYNAMTNEEARAGCVDFGHFLQRLQGDKPFAEQRIKYARKVDSDLVDSGVGMQQRAVLAEGATSTGGALVPPQFIQELLDIARANAVAFQAGVQMRSTNSNIVDMPALSTSATAAWVAENGAISPSNQTFAQQTMTISKLGGGVKVSNELIADADPSIIEIIQNDLALVLALKLDLGIFEGSGSTPEIQGIAGTSGVTAGPSLGTNGRSISIKDLYDAMYNLYAVNIADEDRWSVVFHPRALNTLREIVDTTGNFILSSGSGVNAPVSRPKGLLGLPYFMSTQLSIARTVGSNADCSNIYLGRFYEMIAFMSGAFTIDLSNAAADATNSAWWSDQTWLRAKQRVGFLVRRPAGVCVITGVRA